MTFTPAPRRWRARIFILLGATALALGLAEWATRVFFAGEVVLFPRNHTDAQYGAYRLRRLRPSTTFRHTSIDGSWTFTTNAQGFRDTHDWRHERTPGVRRVMCLGDSHTQGFEVRQDHTFSAIVERRLARINQPTEVLNCGISGFGTAEELAFFENEGVNYAPDVVVLAWFANDPDDNVKSGLFAVRDGRLVETGREHLPGVSVLNAINRVPPLRWAGEHSWFYSLLFNRVWEARKGMLSKERAAAAVEFATKAPALEAGAATYQDELAAKLVERLHAFCRAHGARLVILDIPLRKADDDFESSVPPGLTAAFQTHSDVFLPAEQVLGPFRGATELFVAHGQQHISETTHLLLGAAVAAQIAGQ